MHPSLEEKRFQEEVIARSGSEIFSCYQCSKCSAGCPVTFAMDILPHQIIRYILFFKKDKVLSSRTLWVCATCETCTTRCPNNIDIARLMDVLRQLQREYGIKPSELKAPIFHTVFLETIKRWGRVYEMGMLGHYYLKSGEANKKIRTGEWREEVRLGLKMFLRGKLKLFPSRCKGVKEIQRIFERAEEIRPR